MKNSFLDIYFRNFNNIIIGVIAGAVSGIMIYYFLSNPDKTGFLEVEIILLFLLLLIIIILTFIISLGEWLSRKLKKYFEESLE